MEHLVDKINNVDRGALKTLYASLIFRARSYGQNLPEGFKVL